MKIYDISQEVFGCVVYPGDESPEKREVCKISNGDGYNLTCFSMCAHNGTHVDAPCHFIDNGISVDKIPLEKLIGNCYVTEFSGIMTAKDALNILSNADEYGQEGKIRLLFKGDAVITADAATVFSENGICLIGTESQSVGEINSPAQVHRILLDKEIVLLEGIRLSHVSTGIYLLNAAPICLGGTDGAPCRAILIEMH